LTPAVLKQKVKEGIVNKTNSTKDKSQTFSSSSSDEDSSEDEDDSFFASYNMVK